MEKKSYSQNGKKNEEKVCLNSYSNLQGNYSDMDEAILDIQYNHSSIISFGDNLSSMKETHAIIENLEKSFLLVAVEYYQHATTCLILTILL